MTTQKDRRKRLNTGTVWTACFFACTIGLLTIYGAFMFRIDPFNYYHPESHWHAPDLFTGIYQYVAGMLKYTDYDEVLIGSSLCQNFRVSSIKKKLKWNNPIKCTTGGINDGDIIAYALKAIRDGKAKKILIGIGFHLFNKGRAFHKDDFFPSYLYDTTPLNDSRYLFNPHLFIDNTIPIKKFFTAKTPSAHWQLDRDSMWSWDLNGTLLTYWPYWENPHPGKPGNRSIAEALRKVGKTYGKENRKTDVPLALFSAERFEAFVKEVIEDYPDVEFYIFTTPVSVLIFKALQQNLDSILDVHKQCFLRLIKLKNVKVYNPQADPEIFCNLSHYKDLSHYSFAVNEMILDGIASEKHRITADNIDSTNNRMKNAVLDFDPRPWIDGLDQARDIKASKAK